MGTDHVVVRDASLDDIDYLVMLLKQLFSIEEDFDFNPEKQKRGLSMLLDGCGKHRTLKVAQYKGRVVGMCSVQTRISTAQGNWAAMLEDLVVDEAFRKMGIGKKLLKEALLWSKKRGIDKLWLLADKDNSNALEFYQAQGWVTSNLICLFKST